MATIAELQGRLESNMLAINSLTQQIRGVKTDLDFPHTLKTMLEKADGAIKRMKDELASAEHSRTMLVNRLDTELMELRYADLIEQKEALLNARQSLNQELTAAREHAGNVQEVKGELSALRKLVAGKTQEEILAMVADMFKDMPASEGGAT